MNTPATCTLVALSGSLRKDSLNTRLLRVAASLAPANVRLEVVTLQGIPLYDGDLEAAEGMPAAVTALKQRIIAADGLLIATPEYNNGMPGVLKNGLDWLSRPPKDTARVFGNLPVAVVGASPGGFGTILAQNHILPVLRTLGTRPWFGGRLMVSRAGSVFNDAGEVTDAALREQIAGFVAGFASFARETGGQRAGAAS
jgi:chromate reductase